jgi:hypothetical protein
MTERESIVIRRLDGGPRLIIEDAAQLAWEFFTKDPSSAGPAGYDNQVGKTDPVRIVDQDITTINQTLRTRNPHAAWAGILDTREPLPWLLELDPRWDLVLLSEARWQRTVRPAMAAALSASIGPHRGLARTTKVLHLKRPKLFPLLDRLVVEQVGAVGRSPIDIVEHLRAEAIANRPALRFVVTALEKVHLRRSAVRVLDALLWASHPASSLVWGTASWDRRIGPREGTEAAGNPDERDA